MNADSTDVVLQLDQLTKTFGNHQAVADVTLAVRRGEIFGFLGPNGAGKSTTIRLILDVLRPTSGSVSLFGAKPRQPAARQRLGYLSGDMVMDGNLTGRQYLTFVSAQYGKDCRSRRTELAQLLQADLDIKVGHYSRGNRQKIGLIAALQHEPELLLLDEPTSGFDPLVQEQFAGLIRQFRQAGGTVFMSSHILSEVQQLCDRAAFIKEGRLVSVAAIGELTEHAAKRVTVRAGAPELARLRQAVNRLDGARLQPALEEYVLQFSYGGPARRLLRLLAGYDIGDVTIKEPELEEVFMRFYEPDRPPAADVAAPTGLAGGKGGKQ